MKLCLYYALLNGQCFLFTLQEVMPFDLCLSG
jgi:hypothetical protein